jgi:RimJ/RimL family protein N-acetyltransferase
MNERLELQLHDGTPVIVRPLIPDDRPLLAEAYRIVSPEARYNRFWTGGGDVVGDKMLDRVLDQDANRHVTWTVLDPSRDFPPMGGASWWRDPQAMQQAEISAIVLDGDQGRGIGTLLFAVMWITAFRAGIRHLTGYCLTDNRAAANWMRDCGGEGEWNGSHLAFRWDLENLDALKENRTAADLARWLADLSQLLLPDDPSTAGK